MKFITVELNFTHLIFVIEDNSDRILILLIIQILMKSILRSVLITKHQEAYNLKNYQAKQQTKIIMLKLVLSWKEKIPIVQVQIVQEKWVCLLQHQLCVYAVFHHSSPQEAKMLKFLLQVNIMVLVEISWLISKLKMTHSPY